MKALITGITGQDGAYLAQLLLSKGYEVHGVKRRSSSFNTGRIDGIFEDPNLHLHYGDVTDSSNIIRIIEEVQPHEIYNLAAMSHVQVSFEQPEYVANADGIGALRILEAIRLLSMENKTKFYQASTSELYGNAASVQSEHTPFHPRSPYAVAKLFAYWTTVNYRNAYGIFACNGILFNHESPLRGETFVTRKITMGVAKIVAGISDKIVLGNLNAQRDWGHAKDYVEAMRLMMQKSEPDDYVIATGKTETVRNFVRFAFLSAGISIHFSGEGLNEVATVDEYLNGYTGAKKVKEGEVVVRIDPKYFRPTEVDILCGDHRKASHQLRWEATTTLRALIEEMVQSDIKLIAEKHGQIK